METRKSRKRRNHPKDIVNTKNASRKNTSTQSRPISQIFQMSASQNQTTESYVSNIEASQSTILETFAPVEANKSNNAKETLKENFSTVDSNSSELIKSLSSLGGWHHLETERLTKEIRVRKREKLCIRFDFPIRLSVNNLWQLLKSLCHQTRQRC